MSDAELYSKLLVHFAPGAFLGVLAVVCLWEAIGHHVERGLSDARTIAWFSAAASAHGVANIDVRIQLVVNL